jgi:hypothetical protein
MLRGCFPVSCTNVCCGSLCFWLCALQPCVCRVADWRVALCGVGASVERPQATSIFLLYECRCVHACRAALFLALFLWGLPGSRGYCCCSCWCCCCVSYLVLRAAFWILMGVLTAATHQGGGKRTAAQHCLTLQCLSHILLVFWLVRRSVLTFLWRTSSMHAPYLLPRCCRACHDLQGRLVPAELL